VVQERKRQNGKRNQSQYDHHVEVSWIGHAPLLRSLTDQPAQPLRVGGYSCASPNVPFQPLNRRSKLLIVQDFT
jgi:hypothetical protein